MRVTEAHGLDQLEAVELGHLEVGDDHVGHVDGELIEGLAAVGGEGDLVAGLAEDAAGARAIEARVVHHEHRRHDLHPVWRRCVIALARSSIMPARARRGEVGKRPEDFFSSPQYWGG